MNKKNVLNPKGKGVKFLGLFFLFVLASSCKRTENAAQQATKISFTSTIEGQLTTKATGVNWEPGDKIGVFMLEAGKALEEKNILNNVDNIPFTINGNVFQSANPVYLPKTTTADFVAFYPQKAVNNYHYAIDLTDQSNQSALDLMYANNAKGITGNNSAIPLVFTRQLSRVAISLSVTNTEALKAEEMKASMNEVNVLASFDLRNATLSNATERKTIFAKVSPHNNQQALVEFTLLPGEQISGKSIRFQAANGDSYTWKVPQVAPLKKGERFTFVVKIDNGKPSDNGGPKTQAYFELPKIENLGKDMEVVAHMMPEDASKRNYTMLYDKQLRMAYWVAYPLHASYMGGAKRTDKWAYDPKIISNFQYAIFSGFSGGGWDRGHQLPSADRTSSTQANYTTFYFSNMTAQNSRLNQGMWANLEGKIRTWTAQCDTMYVVTGAMPDTPAIPVGSKVKDNNGVLAVTPKYYFKALAMKKGTSYYTIAYKMNNVDPGTNNKYESYQMPVSELEAATGFSFFPDLTKAEKSSINTSIWK